MPDMRSRFDPVVQLVAHCGLLADAPTTAFAWRPARCLAGYRCSSTTYLPDESSKTLLVPKATRLLTRFNLFTREFESSRWWMVKTLQQRDMKTPGQFPGRTFPLTVTSDKVRQIGFGSLSSARTGNWAVIIAMSYGATGLKLVG